MRRHSGFSGGFVAQGLPYLFAFVFLTIVYSISYDLHSNATIFIDDGLEYSKVVERGEAPANPHHLLYHPLALAVHKIMRTVSPEMFRRSVISLQLFSSAMGALGVLFFYTALRLLVRNGMIALLASTALAFCRGYWYYSAAAETIVPGVAMSIISFYFLIAVVERPSRLRIVFLGFVNALAILMRQDNFLLLIPFSYLILASMPEGGMKTLAYYWLPFMAATTATYAAVFLLGAGGQSSLSGFYSWCTLYNQHPGWGDFQNVGMNGLTVGLVRFFQSVGLGGLANVPLISSVPIPPRLQHFSVFTSYPLAGALLLILILSSAGSKNAGSSKKNLATMLFVWIITRELFYLWWLPEVALSWSVGSMVPFWALVGLSLGKMEKTTMRKAMAPLACAMACAVFLSGALTIACAARHDYYKRLAFYNCFSREGDLVLVREFHDYPLLTYFGGREAVILDYGYGLTERSLSPSYLDAIINNALKDGRKVILMPYTEGASLTSCFNPRYRTLEEGFFAKYKITPLYIKQQGNKTVAAWQIHPTPTVELKRHSMEAHIRCAT